MNSGNKAVVEGAVRCEWCARPATEGTSECEECGGPIRVLEPWVVECGWCGVSNRRDETVVCKTCGGPLPTIPGGHPGPRPPPAPRTLPEGYTARIKYKKNVYTILGIVFTIVLFWSLIFPLIGIVLWVYGLRRAGRKLQALVHGTPTKGRILDVSVDTTKKINKRHPWKVVVEYETLKGPFIGESEAWDSANAKRPPGEEVWVVYVPESPDLYAIWPPIH